MHHKSNTARALVFAILSILFSGCTLSTFEHPIESLDEANVPTELFGLYHGVNAKDYAVCTLLVEPAASVVPNRVEKKTTDSQPEITPEPKVESITVTAESDALRTFIRENLDQGLFSAKDNPRYKRAK